MSTHHPLLRALPAFAAFTLASVLMARPVLAADLDSDADGVADVADDCPDTAAGELVGADGCEACPCEETAEGDAWASKKAYIACIGAAAKDAGLSKKARRAAIKRAKQAACGDDDLTRCCVWPDGDGSPKCKVTTYDKCGALGESHDVDELGPGSCAPSPCEE